MYVAWYVMPVHSTTVHRQTRNHTESANLHQTAILNFVESLSSC